MALSRSHPQAPTAPPSASLSQAAYALASQLPRLTLQARQVARSVHLGTHGRRRAGSGENFWQFRSFVAGEAAHHIDWRRSARDATLYVREREWETTHTVWLWFDQSPSMQFRSAWAQDEKFHHGLILGLAAADVLMRSGEQIGLWQTHTASRHPHIIDHLALMLLHTADPSAEIPNLQPLGRFHDLIVITDGLSPLSQWQHRIKDLSVTGGRGHLVIIRDPAEQTLPYEGHYRLHATESEARLEIGDIKAFRARYQDRIGAHDQGLQTLCAQHHWMFHHHTTDKPLPAVLLALVQNLLQRPHHHPIHG